MLYRIIWLYSPLLPKVIFDKQPFVDFPQLTSFPDFFLTPLAFPWPSSNSLFPGYPSEECSLGKLCYLPRQHTPCDKGWKLTLHCM